MFSQSDIPADLLLASELAYEPCGMALKHFMREDESQEYSACTFEMNSRRIKFRTAKITPTKIGQFVTLWKRIDGGVILPHDLSDPFDLYIVSVRCGKQFGQFVFPKKVLLEKSILSKEGKNGKRAMRVYPPWDITDSKQAKHTQKWQVAYFFEILDSANVAVAKIRELFGKDS